MSTELVTTGQDTMVSTITPDVTFDVSQTFLQAGPGQAVLLSMPVSSIADEVVTAAPLRMVVSAQSIDSPTISVLAVDEEYDPATVNGSSLPATRSGTTASIALTAPPAPNDEIVVDLQPILQPIADGLPDYGFMITSDVTVTFASFESVRESWQLTVETSDVPSAPSSLTPNGGVVSVAKPVLRMDYTDLGGDSSLGAVQVRIGSTDGVWSYTSPETPAVSPELDLSTTAYAGIGTNATIYWQGRVRSAEGVWSAWSDTASVTRKPKGALSITSPGSTITSPKPTVRFSVASGAIESFRVWVFDAKGAERFDSGRKANRPVDGSVSFGIPFRRGGALAQPVGGGPIVGNARDVVFPKDGDYTIRVRTWDDDDRVSGGKADPPYQQAEVTVTLDTSPEVFAPVDLTAEPAADGPGVDLVWTLGAGVPAPDSFTIKRNGLRVDNLEVAPIATSPLIYAYTDRGALPNTLNTYTVRCSVEDDEGPIESDDSPQAFSENPATGLWLHSAHGSVCLRGDDIGSLKYADKRVTFDLPYRQDRVDLVGALSGLSGSFSGALYEDDGDVEEARDVLRAIRQDVATPVWLVYGTTAAPVLLANVSVTASPDLLPTYNRNHVVSFDCWQVDDFAQTG